MSKKTYRRLLLTAFMLSVVVFLTYTSPNQHAAQNCEQCHLDCETAYELCLQQGSHCEQSRTLCHEARVLICS